MSNTNCACYHCGLAVPPDSDYTLSLDGQSQRFCCPGCLAVASAIIEGGLGSFYQFRSVRSSRPGDHHIDFSIYDLDDVQQEFVDQLADGERQANLLLTGITCAACVWLIEKHLAQLPGVVAVRVNATTHRCLLRWRPAEGQLSELMRSLSDIGYEPLPATESQRQQLREKEDRTALMRLAVAGFGMMQVGMVAVGLYAGADSDWQGYLRWISLIIATPVVFYSARPFFSAALRALRTRHLTMDVPVSIAIAGAFAASCWATVFGGGEVYFDSVSMFTFFLLLGRYLEMRARHRNGIDSDRLAQLLPVTAEVWRGERWQAVPLKQVAVGDRVLVASGAIIPCDGTVLSGTSGVVETLLTGEPDAVIKGVGDTVIAGSTNTESSLQVEVTAIGRGTRLSAIERLVEQARQNKPRMAAIADTLAGYFVAAVLLVSLVVGAVWWQIDSSHAVWVVLSVLVVTCPCALSLASPTALTTAISWLRQQGLLVTGEHLLEGLPKVDRVIFDKTGTLTLGEPQVAQVLQPGGEPLDDIQRARLLAVCAALETGSRHPIARAFAPYASPLQAEELRQFTAQGVEGRVGESGYRLGKPGFAGHDSSPPQAQGQWLALSCDEQLCAWICLQDQLRPSAAVTVQALQARGIQVELLSGDDAREVARVAGQLGIAQWRADQSPDQKLAITEQYQQQGERVLMVGDGINDVPVLSGAFISVAMGGATDLAQTRADSVLLGCDLSLIPAAMRCAVLTRRVIRQNLGWALLYNLIALPAAAMGLIPPWAAAIGMSASSLIVVSNALRINRLSLHDAESRPAAA